MLKQIFSLQEFSALNILFFIRLSVIMPFLYPIKLSRLKACILAYLSTTD
ncbi:hypothetical protein M072_3700 [Bacteroides fragilis str. DS-208]|nr:hypothetical protein M072_3700 [Bacteroides fragilis str. DS-208]